MIYQYGSRSSAKLSTCHNVLQLIMIEALEDSPYDISIIHGWRGEEVQNALEESGASHKRFPDSTHNQSKDPQCPEPFKTSDAVDFAPYINGRIPWNDTHIFAVIAGVIIAAGKRRGITMRWGGDWDSDGSTKDQTLMDWGHIEVIWNSTE